MMQTVFQAAGQAMNYVQHGAGGEKGQGKGHGEVSPYSRNPNGPPLSASTQNMPIQPVDAPTYHMFTSPYAQRSQGPASSVPGPGPGVAAKASSSGLTLFV